MCIRDRQITGTKSTLYRAPYGEYNSTVIKSAQDKKLYPIQWNLDTLDYTCLLYTSVSTEKYKLGLSNPVVKVKGVCKWRRPIISCLLYTSRCV